MEEMDNSLGALKYYMPKREATAHRPTALQAGVINEVDGFEDLVRNNSVRI